MATQDWDMRQTMLYLDFITWDIRRCCYWENQIGVACVWCMTSDNIMEKLGILETSIGEIQVNQDWPQMITL